MTPHHPISTRNRSHAETPNWTPRHTFGPLIFLEQLLTLQLGVRIPPVEFITFLPLLTMVFPCFVYRFYYCSNPIVFLMLRFFRYLKHVFTVATIVELRGLIYTAIIIIIDKIWHVRIKAQRWFCRSCKAVAQTCGVKHPVWRAPTAPRFSGTWLSRDNHRRSALINHSPGAPGVNHGIKHPWPKNFSTDHQSQTWLLLLINHQ